MDNVPDSLALVRPEAITPSLAFAAPFSVQEIGLQRWTDETATGDTRLRSTVSWELTYDHPGTWTEAETKEAFSNLMADRARDQCLHIVLNMRSEIIESVLEQLKDLAAYEERMFQVRSEPPRVHSRERWGSLPAARR